LELEVEAEIEEEIKIHKKKMKHRSPIEKITKENVDEWSVVHTPAKEDVVEMTGALEVVEVAPKGSLEEDLDIRGRVEQQVVKERRDERWTEITKDLVVRDAIERLGYEFEETRTFYYIFSFLEPVSLLLCPVLFAKCPLQEGDIADPITIRLISTNSSNSPMKSATQDVDALERCIANEWRNHRDLCLCPSWIECPLVHG
jgi:hypothetical protein